MKMFSSWFGKKKKDAEANPEGGVAQDPQAAGTVTREISVDKGASDVASNPEVADGILARMGGEAANGTALDGDGDATESPDADGDANATLGENIEAEAEGAVSSCAQDESSEIGEAQEPEALASGTRNRFGGLGKMWEATRRLALTPVDPWFAKMAQGLNKTRQSLVGQVKNLLGSHSAIDDDLWDELEDILLTADVGIGATERILEELRQVVKEKKISDPTLLTGELKAILGRILGAEPTAEGAEEVEAVTRGLKVEHGKLMVVLMVGVNGAGKTTTTAKIAALYKNQGYKVLMAAADTFRAAAIDQLQVWADRIGVDLIRHQEGADPAAVVFDAVSAAKARGTELLLVDTAGRLHNKANLMEELRKIKRVAGRDLEGAPHEIILVLDATTGQNALEQARVFNKVTELTGLILCKLDGTSRGGIIVAIAQEFSLPVRYIGVGEAVDDLREFNPEQFLAALFSEEEPAT